MTNVQPLFLVIPGHPFYLHELLEDSSLHLPEVVKPPRVSDNFKIKTLLFYSVHQAARTDCRAAKCHKYDAKLKLSDATCTYCYSMFSNRYNFTLTRFEL